METETSQLDPKLKTAIDVLRKHTEHKGNFMKYFLKYICLYLICLLPLKILAKPTDQIIFVHPEDKNELWMTDIRDTLKSNRIYKHNETIWDFAVQKDGPYVVFIAGHAGEIFEYDVYLIDRNQSDEKARNLTQKQFEEVWDLDISINGDIVFTNVPTGVNPNPKTGIFLIPNSEIKKETPSIRRITAIEAHDIVWSPAGDQFAFSTLEGIFIRDINTPRVTHVSNVGFYPTFSPDGKKIAFLSKGIHIRSLSKQPNQNFIKLEHKRGAHLKWSTDGEYFVYQTFLNTCAISIKGGPTTKLFEHFPYGAKLDWVHSKGYSVNPTERLIIAWGKLKQYSRF